MLSEDVMTPGKFPQIDMGHVGFVCLCYLTTPSEAKHSYVLRRISALVKEARVLSVAWSGTEDSSNLQSPASAVSLLPTTTAVAAAESSDAPPLILETSPV